MSSRFQSRLAPKVGVSRLVTVNTNLNNNQAECVKQEGVTPVPGEPRSQCICNRPQQLVMCQGCGFTLDGRIRLQCPAHPAVTFLLDLNACPQCRAAVVKLREFPKSSDANTSRRIKPRTELMETDG